MRQWLNELDRVLRGKATSLPALKDGTIHVSAGGLTVVLIFLAAIYGTCMGFYGLVHRSDWLGWQQMASSILKMPALFLLTLIVTFPSLYVFNALVGSQLTLRALGRLMVAAMSVLLAVLASFGPIVAFFSVTTTSHPFIQLLNVACCALAGCLGMGFLLQTLHRMSLVMEAALLEERGEVKPAATLEGEAAMAVEVVTPETSADPIPHAAASSAATPSPTTAQPGVTSDPTIGTGTAATVMPPRRSLSGHPLLPPTDQGALDRISGSLPSSKVKTVFRFWVILFGLVGAQMSWVLRPFIGKTDEAFVLFAPQQSNFFEAVLKAIGQLFGWQN